MDKKQQWNTLSYLRPTIEQIKNKKFRDSYLSESIKIFLAAQIRNLRGDKTQEEFATMLGTTQSVVSRYEDSEYGKVTLQTLLDIAQKLDIGLVVRFVNFQDFFRMTNDFSPDAQCPKPYNHNDMEQFLEFSKKPKATLVDSVSTVGNKHHSSLNPPQNGLLYSSLLKQTSKRIGDEAMPPYEQLKALVEAARREQIKDVDAGET
jgi:transcriptional regulator with XRE-family HTH domain